MRSCRNIPSRAARAAAIALAGAIAPASAQPVMSGSEHVSIRATSDFDQMHPGQLGLLAIDIIVEDGWHTYWPGVSETGYGISFDINAPECVELKDPIWPSPERHLQKGGILDHTYEGTNTVLVPCVIKSDTDAQAAVFSIDASFLVCDQMCLPGEGSATTAVQIVPEQQPASASSNHDRIEKLYEHRPQLFDAKDISVRLQWIRSAAAVMFRDATRIEFYPDSECSELSNIIEDGAKNGNRLEIRFDKPENKLLSGRLRVQTPEGELQYDIHERAP